MSRILVSRHLVLARILFRFICSGTSADCPYPYIRCLFQLAPCLRSFIARKAMFGLENLVNVALWLSVYYFSCLPITTAVDFLQAFISNPEHDCWYSVLPIDFHRRIHVQLGFCGSVCLITGYIGFLKCKTNVEDQEAQILETAVNLIPLILTVHFGGRGLLLLYSFSFLSAAIPFNPILWFAHLATGISILVLLGLLNFLAGLLLGFTWFIFFLDSKNPSFCDPFTSISGKNRFHYTRCWMVCSRCYYDNE